MMSFKFCVATEYSIIQSNIIRQVYYKELVMMPVNFFIASKAGHSVADWLGRDCVLPVVLFRQTFRILD